MNRALALGHAVTYIDICGEDICGNYKRITYPQYNRSFYYPMFYWK